MDIELPDGNGMEIAEKVRSYDSRVVIIFVTNMAQFAIDGYGVGALDYILKPLKETSFQAKLARAIEAAKRNETQKFSFNSGRKQVVLSVDEIEYVEVSGHDLSVYTAQTCYKTRGSLNTIEADPKFRYFARCSNYCLVNLSKISAVDHDIVYLGKKTLFITRTKRNSFLSSFTEYLGR